MNNLTLEQCGTVFWLLARDVIFLSTYNESIDDWDDGFSFELNCNDTFYYACGDSESLEIKDINDVKLLYDKFSWDGLAAWVAIKRNEEVLIELQSDKYFEAKEFINKRFGELNESIETI